MSDKKIKIQYIHSPIGRKQDQKDTVRCLGFSKLYEIREVSDVPTIRGMINKIPHLVKVIEE